MISLLSNLSPLCTTSQVNGSPSANGGAHNDLGLHHLHAQKMGVGVGGGRTDAGKGWADWPRPISARFGRPFLQVGPPVILDFYPFNCIIVATSSLRLR
jgi:hypothetical protein